MPTASPEVPSVTVPLSTTLPSTTAVALGGPAISYGGVSFNLESSLGISIGARLVPTQAEDANGPAWSVHPQYTELVLGGYPSKNTYHQPRIEVYPVAAFEATSPGAKQIIERLKLMLASKSVLISGVSLQPETSIPFLPLFNAAQIFHAKPEYLSFRNGTGVRFITQFDQAPIPVNNRETFYTFQGLTSDGQFYVVAILPVTAPVLADTDKIDATGPQVVPFPANDMTEQALNKYFADVIAKLDALPPDQFTPSLAALDALIQSMQVGP